MTTPSLDQEVAASVLISLAIKSPDNLALPERRIRLTPEQPTVQIGRSSARPFLDLQPLGNNLLFDSPVMSRNHAVIKADIPKKVLTISDMSSLHGTYLNSGLKVNSEVRLKKDDDIIFGVPVYRNAQTFQPAVLTLQAMDFQNVPVVPRVSPNRVFTVPDDCSVDDNEPSDELAETSPSNHKNDGLSVVLDPNASAEATLAKPGKQTSQIDGAFDLESEPESLEGSDWGNGTPEDWGFEVDNDESFDSRIASPTTFDENSKTPRSDNRDSEAPLLEPSLDDTQSGSEEESMDNVSDHFTSPLEDEDEEGMFLYDTDSDDSASVNSAELCDPSEGMDEDVESTSVSNPGQQQQGLTASAIFPTPGNGTWLPSLSDVLTSEPVNDTIPLVNMDTFINPPLRLPSLLSLTGGESLGSQHSQTLQQTVDLAWGPIPKANRSGEDLGRADALTNIERNLHEEPRLGRDLPDTQAVDLNRPCCDNVLDKVAFSEPISDSSLHTDAVVGDDILPSAPQPSTNEVTTSTREAAVPDDRTARETICKQSFEGRDSDALQHHSTTAEWMAYKPHSLEPRSAYELFQLKQRQNSQRQDVITRSTENETCVLEAAPENVHCEASAIRLPATRKRKAAEISDLVEAERTNDQMSLEESSELINDIEDSEMPALDTQSKLPVQAQSPLPSPPASPEQSVQEQRPAKRIKVIAERMGYAALGGATVGAMVLTSLIYTAPSFT